MFNVHGIDADLFITALEQLPTDRYSCHAITSALKESAQDPGRYTYSNPSPVHDAYAELFAPDLDYVIQNDACSAWLHDDDAAPLFKDDSERREWRETALCMMAAICADPWKTEALAAAQDVCGLERSTVHSVLL